MGKKMRFGAGAIAIAAIAALAAGVWYGAVPWLRTQLAPDMSPEEIYALLDEREFSSALYASKKGMQQHPDQTTYRFLLARSCEGLGHKDKAFGVYLKLSEDYPDAPEPPYYLGKLTYTQNKIEQAVSYYGRAVELAKKIPAEEADSILITTYVALGEIYKGFYKKHLVAAGFYSKALELDPENWEIRYSLGVAYAYGGRPKQAYAEFNLIMEKNPGSQIARYAENAIMYVREGRKPNISYEPV